MKPILLIINLLTAISHKQKAVLTALLFLTISLNAQVGIGTTAPEGILDIRSTTNGVVFPKIALTAKNVALPVVNPNGGGLCVGTVIYNTSTAGTAPNSVSPGYYFWNGTSWETFSSTSATNVGTAVSNSSPVEPIIGNSYTATNSTTGTANVSTLQRTVSFSGTVGNILAVTCNIDYTSYFHGDVAVYLKSPTGQIINLKLYEGPGVSGSTTTPDNLNVTISDNGATILPSSWVLGAGLTGTFKPTANMFMNNISSPSVTPTISTMSGFDGFSANGTWTLYFKDDAPVDVATFNGFTLNIITGSPTYKLIGESSITYKTSNKIIVNATYAANVTDDFGVITSLTRTTATAGATGTTVSTLPGTLLCYSSDSPNVGAGNYWTSTTNQAVCISLVDGTTYYFQLWAKSNVEAPIASNQQFSLVSFQMP